MKPWIIAWIVTGCIVCALPLSCALCGCCPTSVTVMDANRVTLNVYLTVEANAVQVSIPVSIHFEANAVPVTIPVQFSPTINIQGHLLGATRGDANDG